MKDMSAFVRYRGALRLADAAHVQALTLKAEREGKKGKSATVTIFASKKELLILKIIGYSDNRTQ